MLQPKACNACRTILGCKDCVNRALNRDFCCFECRASGCDVFDMIGIDEPLTKLRQIDENLDEDEEEN
uniref:Uncharacterized protein n=1 Tax=Romanomermis culicivorax TaxID=13658 RepID=A0A915KV03_ROMCU